MRKLAILSLIVCIAATSGCNVCCWGKRASELGSPTDIRKAHYWCLGEDAIFHQPCGPSKEDYGLKATCWREWPAEGGRCKPGTCPPASNCGPNGNCAAPLLPLIAPQQDTSPQWEGPTPAETLPNLNPFHDDEPTLPAPTNTDKLPPGDKTQFQGIGPKQSTLDPSFGARTSAVKLPVRQLPQRQASTSVTAPRSIAVTPIPVRPPALLGPTTGELQRPKASQPLRIAVSPQFDTPARVLPQIASANASPMPKPTPADVPRLDAETLAGFKQMYEAPTATLPEKSQSLVVRNDFAQESKPFRLATRTSEAKTANDAVLKKDTLSALESMISSDAEPAASR